MRTYEIDLTKAKLGNWNPELPKVFRVRDGQHDWDLDIIKNSMSKRHYAIMEELCLSAGQGNDPSKPIGLSLGAMPVGAIVRRLT